MNGKWLHILICLCYGITGQTMWLTGQDLDPVAPPRPRIEAVSPTVYGTEGQIWDIATGSKGLLYVASAAGVLRYDGANWTSLRLPGGPTVRAIALTEQRLYAGGYGAFGYFPLVDGQAGNWVSLSSELSPSDQNEEIWNIETFGNGQVAFQSFGRLFFYDGQQTTTVSPPGVMMFAVAQDNTLWVPVNGVGIYQWSAATSFTLVPGSAALGQQKVVSLIPRGQDLLLGTEESVYVLKDGRLTDLDARLSRQLSGKKINRILPLRDGFLAIGTIAGGLYLFQPETGQALHLNEDSGLSNNTVLSLYESQNGNVWLGLDQGLDLVVRSPSVSFVTGQQRPPGTVYAAARANGQVYFGTNQGVYLQKPSATGYQYTLIPGTSGQVWELRPAAGGLLCGHNDGTFMIRDSTAQLISDRTGGWMTLPAGGPDTTALLQATYTGLQRLVLRQGQYQATDLPGLAAPIRQILWLEEQKLLAMHSSRNAFILTLNEDASEILGIDTINHPVLTKSSALTTPNGILLQSAWGRRLLREDSLLISDTLRGVPLKDGEYAIDGGNGTTWFIAGADRVRLFEHDKLIAEWPLKLRLPYPEILPWGSDTWLFLLDQGYALVRPKPESQITHLLLETEFQDQGRWVKSDHDTTGLAIDYRNNDLRFSVVLPAYDRPVEYRSRLLGYSEEWSEWSESNNRVFTNLPEGTYRFEAEANWFGGSVSLPFSIAPPWYRTSIAYISYTALTVGALWLLYLLHLKRLRTQARRLELVRRRELQRERMVARNRELEANIKQKSQELANTTLVVAKKNEILLELRQEISKARKSRGSSLNHSKIDKLIDRNLNNEEDWAIFESHFNEVHEVFLKQLRKNYPTLTTGDLKLAAYLRMNLSSKEIAPLLHISVRGVENKRYRLRKKLGLEGGEDLNTFLLEF